MKRIIALCSYSLIANNNKDLDEIRKNKIFEANKKSMQLIKTYKEKAGIPGIAVHVNVNGKYQIATSYGYNDIENGIKCRPNTLMRIASISKSFTSVIAMKLMEEGLLDLDEDINIYLKSFPTKVIDSKKVAITCRQLLSHRSGIRHYKMKEGPDSNESKSEEFLNQTRYTDTMTALKFFQDDDLVFSPGQKYLYSSHGYVLLSAILEKIAEKSTFYFPYIENKNGENITTQSLERMFAILFQKLNLTNTHCEYYENILANRSRQYKRNCESQCKLESAPYVDNSCKWASGGLVSTCQDLCKFAEHLVKIWHGKIDGIITKSSLKILWTPVPGNESKDRDGGDRSYGLGWTIREKDNRLLVGHTGGAIGGTSVLQINLSKTPSSDDDYIIVTILCNMENISGNIQYLAEDISRLFEENNIY